MWETNILRRQGEVKEIIKKLGAGKVPGTDNFSAKMLKHMCLLPCLFNIHRNGCVQEMKARVGDLSARLKM